MNKLSYVALIFLAAVIAPLALRAEPKTFILDQNQSGLAITGDVLGSSFVQQGAGSLTTRYSGTIEVDLNLPNITFIGGSLIAGLNNGNWQPSVGGTSTTAEPANYGGRVTIIIVVANAAIRNALFDVSSAGSTIVNGAFPATDLTFSFPPAANTTIDYRYSTTGGSEQLVGNFPNAAATNATFTTIGSEYVLTIPVDISGTQPTDVGDVNYRLRGKLVAKAPAPVVPIPLKITAFSYLAASNQVNMSIDSTIGQHFTVLGTTNFINWTTNDAFTASVTNTARSFSVPAATVRPRQYFRVRQD